MDPGDTMPLTPPPVFAVDNDDDANLYDHFSTDFHDHFSTALVAETTYESDDPFMGFVANPSPPDDTFPDHD